VKVIVGSVKPGKNGLLLGLRVESDTWLKFEVSQIPWGLLDTREVMRALLEAHDSETPPPWDEDVPLDFS
jgi:hypothetical protein